MTTDKRGRGQARRRDKAKAARAAAPGPQIHLDDDLVRELGTAARPGKKDLLIKVMAEAVVAYSEGNVEEAIRLGEQAKHMALRSTTAREFLGLAYYAAGRWRDAITELSAFRRMAATAEQNPVLADCYRAEGKPEKAVELADETRAHPPSAPVLFESEIVAAGALADLGRLDEAIARLEDLPLDPEVAEEHHLRAWYVLGDLLERKGRFTQAQRYFNAVGAADPELTDAPERAARLEG